MKIPILILFILISFKLSISQTVWTQQNSSTTYDFYAISFFDEYHGYVSGEYAQIYYTSTGGINWQLVVASSAFNDRIECIAFRNINSIVAGSYNSLLYSTTNAGANWTFQTISPHSRINEIFFINENTGWLVGKINATDGYVYRKTTNGGETWYDPSAPLTFSNNNLFDIKFLNTNTGFICGSNPNKGVIAKTVDGGVTWAKTEFGQGYYWGNLDFINENTGWVIGQNYGTKLLKTTNGGNNWNIIFSDTINYFINDIHFVNNDIGYYIGGAILKTSNSGTNWLYNPIQNTPASLESIFFLNSQTGYVCGYNGSIYKTTNGGLTSVNTISHEVPKSITLSQNYPNPFNPSTNFKFGISEKGLVSLKVFDALGKEVATVVNEVLSPGNYNYQFSTVNYQLPSGVYFYKLEAGDFVETKRMVLLK